MPKLPKKSWPPLRAIRHALFGAAVFGAVFLGALPSSSEAGSHLDSTHKLETAFIFQFTNYIEWPETDAGPFVISLLGDDGLLPDLEELAKKKLVKGREIIVLFARDPSQLKASHIIVVHTDDEELLRLAVKRNNGALIVSHSEGFAEKGAMINFFEDAERLRFEINRRAIEGQKLVVSSQLLKLARIIE